MFYLLFSKSQPGKMALAFRIAWQYGYDPSTTRLQRVFEVAQRSSKITRKASGRHQELADLENLP